MADNGTRPEQRDHEVRASKPMPVGTDHGIYPLDKLKDSLYIVGVDNDIHKPD